MALCCVGVHSTRLFVRMVRLVLIEWHSIHWYSIGEKNLIIGHQNISNGFRLSRGAFYSTISSNRQLVSVRLSGVNICCLRKVYQSIDYFSISDDLYRWHQSTSPFRTALDNRLRSFPFAPMVRIARLL